MHESTRKKLEQLKMVFQERKVPNVSMENGMFLYMLVRMLKPARILEIGTANGLSTLFFAEALKENGLGTITTLEAQSHAYEEACAYFSEWGHEERITSLCGDAKVLIPSLDGKYDLVFVDAMKKEYGEYMRLIKPLIHSGTSIVVDDVIKFRHKMDDFFALLENGEYEYTIVPIDEDDGVMLLTPSIV